VPFKVLPRAFSGPIYSEIRKRDRELYAGLEKAGFQYTFGEDGSGIHALYLRRGAGYYIETGASKMIIDGKIKLKAGVSRRSLQSEIRHPHRRQPSLPPTWSCSPPATAR
jgi:putative flavoprotein involved in K+ transport